VRGLTRIWFTPLTTGRGAHRLCRREFPRPSAQRRARPHSHSSPTFRRARLERVHTSYDAGGKRIFVKDPQTPTPRRHIRDRDAARSTFSPPRRAPSVIPVARDSVMSPSATSTAVRTADTTAVPIVNAITSGDTIDISTGSTVVADNLACRESATYTFPQAKHGRSI